MLEHLRVFIIVSLARSVLETVSGIYLARLVDLWQPGRGAFGLFLLRGEPEAGDREILRLFSVLLLALAALRFVQALGALFAAAWSRRAGILLAAVDFVLPLTLPFALWGLVVYRHPDTKDRFRRRPAVARSM
jgi:hypothetical protein